MPTYEYRCKSCGHELEVFQSMTESPKRKCPECGKNTLERKIGTGAAVLFKGSGFYQTDYRSEAYKKSSEADKKPADAKAEGGGEAKTEAGKSGKSSESKAESKGSEGKKGDAKKASSSKPKKPGADAA